ncbi:MAG: A/G-specific adenine glycosylase [Verrucomicrobia bacterium]|nr:A/G-specific adenine glycosylase [Verrucomicrobiota bacterium]
MTPSSSAASTPASWVVDLVNWFVADHRPMPWRSRPTPYAVWISEVMLQQTQVDTVMPYFRRFMRRFPSLKSLAQAPEQDVLQLWEGLGYYSRARNLQRAARIIRDDHGGRLPVRAAELMRLPGIGAYTAAAIASITQGEPVPAVDGNVLRVLSRFRASATDIAQPAAKREATEFLLPHVATVNPSDFNQALMELGALICRPRNPKCGDCPIATACLARRDNTVDQFPVKTRAAAGPHHDEVAALIIKRNRVLLCRRPTSGLLGGLWELPGGRRKPHEGRTAAVQRTVAAKTSLAVRVGPLVSTLRHAYSHFRITLEVYQADAPVGRAKARGEAKGVRWVPRHTLHTVPCTKTTRAALNQLI